MNEFPVIALAGKSEAALAAAIGAACRGIGFFYVARHGVAPALLDGMFAESARFFALPATAKLDVSIARSFDNRGYVALDAEKLDPTRPGDAKEAFNFGSDDATNQWPPSEAFRRTATDYRAAMSALCQSLHRLFAIDLGVTPDHFRAALESPLATVRLLHYPPHPGAFDGGRFGAAPHTDYGNVTILAQDDRGGLEVRTRDGDWIAAPPIPDTFVCNIGDCLMRWSNDIYISTPHRVVNRSGRERYSIAYFGDARADALVECLPSCVAPTRPARYPPISAGAYLKQRLDATYPFRHTSSSS